MIVDRNEDGRLGPFEDALSTALGYMEQAANVRNGSDPWKAVLWTNAELWLAEGRARARTGGVVNVIASDPTYPHGSTTRGMGYAWFQLATGDTVQVFVNEATRLLVVDVLYRDESGGIEFVRRDIPETGR